jgi:hypothetical protein
MQAQHDAIDRQGRAQIVEQPLAQCLIGAARRDAAGDRETAAADRDLETVAQAAFERRLHGHAEGMMHLVRPAVFHLDRLEISEGRRERRKTVGLGAENRGEHAHACSQTARRGDGNPRDQPLA